MTANDNMTLWRPDGEAKLPGSARKPVEILGHARQLNSKIQHQIVSAFKGGHYEMGLNFLWSRTVASLKTELATVGIELLGEMLGKTDVGEHDDVEDILTARDAIRLAGELGVVSQTDAMRLRHTHELVALFSRLGEEEREREEIDESEAIASLKACVSSVLARPKIKVAKSFVEFRKALESEPFTAGDEKIRTLASSPYFFLRLTINILMNSTKTAVGAMLEHCLSNTNVLLPELWPRLRETEKWHIGHTYAEVYADGKKTSMVGLREALLKVKGFDFVPENLRSNTFSNAADDVLRAHDGMDNFYTELAPMNKLNRLGTSVPNPALSKCMTAVLSVFLGNPYGVSWTASPIASEMLEKLSGDRWRFYLDEVLPNDERILGKLSYEKPCERWVNLVESSKLAELHVKNDKVSKLITAAAQKNEKGVEKQAKDLLAKHYGR